MLILNTIPASKNRTVRRTEKRSPFGQTSKARNRRVGKKNQMAIATGYVRSSDIQKKAEYEVSGNGRNGPFGNAARGDVGRASTSQNQEGGKKRGHRHPPRTVIGRYRAIVTRLPRTLDANHSNRNPLWNSNKSPRLSRGHEHPMIEPPRNQSRPKGCGTAGSA